MVQIGTWFRAVIQANTSAWPDVRPAIKTPEFRWLALIGMMLLPLLLGVDVLAGLLKQFQIFPADQLLVFRLAEQNSVAEFVGFETLQMAAIFCLLIAWRLQSSLHFALATVLEYLILDDMYGLHELAGFNLSLLLTGTTSPNFTESIGELAYGLVACTIIGLLFWSYYRRSAVQLRSLFGMLLVPFVLLGICAVGVDFIHAIVPRSEKYLSAMLVLIEDGGELLAIYLLMLVAAAQWLALTKAATGRTALQQP